MAVCSLVLEQGGDEEQAIAAMLHDAPEDQGGRATLEMIRSRFGDRVARLVEALSDSFETDPDRKLDWTPRKTAYLAQLQTEPDEVKLISLADKLHNAGNIVRDLMADGPLVWDRFKAGRDGTLWYYRELVDAFADFPKPVMVAELRRLVDEITAWRAEAGGRRVGQESRDIPSRRGTRRRQAPAPTVTLGAGRGGCCDRAVFCFGRWFLGSQRCRNGR